jgi:hypothetical protein
VYETGTRVNRKIGESVFTDAISGIDERHLVDGKIQAHIVTVSR